MTLRARAAEFFLEPREPTMAPGDLGDLVPLVRREPPPRRDLAPHDASWLAPARPDPPRAVSPPVPPIGAAPRAAVLGDAGQAVPAAAALACALRVEHGSAAAVVATWVPGAARRAALRGPGSPAAARIAARLSARGLAATAHGRLAWLPLDDHVVAAAVAARRASAALDIPLVVALSGPRCEIVEALLGEQDLVVVVADEPDTPLARLAVAGCARPATARRPPRGVRRLLALAGLAGAEARA